MKQIVATKILGFMFMLFLCINKVQANEYWQANFPCDIKIDSKFKNMLHAEGDLITINFSVDNSKEHKKDWRGSIEINRHEGAFEVPRHIYVDGEFYGDGIEFSHGHLTMLRKIFIAKDGNFKEIRLTKNKDSWNLYLAILNPNKPNSKKEEQNILLDAWSYSTKEDAVKAAALFLTRAAEAGGKCNIS